MPVDLATALRAALEIGVPHFYLDTNVLVDIVQDRQPSSVELLEALQEVGWRCSTSYFALMEALDVEQERHYITTRIKQGKSIDTVWSNRYQRDLDPRALGRIRARVYRATTNRFGFVKPLYLEEAGWELAIDLAARSNILAADCVHLATAMITGCDVLVTRDSNFRREASRYLVVALPDEAVAQIRRFTTPAQA